MLFNNKQPCLKKSGNEEFDVPMGFDGAEVRKLVGVYILHFLRTVMRKQNVGLYNDDGLGILQNSSSPEIEWKSKEIIKIFRGCRLNITVKWNLKRTDYLDVHFHIIDNTYEPYWKPYSETVYINKYSNDPQNILKELPKDKHIYETRTFLMLQKPHTNKLYKTAVFMTNWNIKTKIVRNKLRMKKRGREEGRWYG